MSEARHIREKMPRKGGNSFYLSRTERIPKTLCGKPCTALDVSNTKSGRLYIESRDGCPDCLRIAGVTS